jgi:Carboxypeptidase regulatory-like domain
MKHKAFLAALVAIAVFFAGELNAQTPKKKSGGTISGVVIGPDDKPAAKASVMCQSSGGLSPHASYTDSKGRFTITGLKPDSYDVRASSNGVFSEWEKFIAIRKSETKEVTLHLIYAKEMPKTAGQTKQKKP